MNVNAIKCLDVNDPLGDLRDGNLIFDMLGLPSQALSARQIAELPQTGVMSEFAAFESVVYDPHITEADCRYSTQEAHELAPSATSVSEPPFTTPLLGTYVTLNDADGYFCSGSSVTTELAELREQIKQLSALLGCDIDVEELAAEVLADEREWHPLPGGVPAPEGAKRVKYADGVTHACHHIPKDYAPAWQVRNDAQDITHYSMRSE